MAIKIPENTLPIRDVLNDDYVRVVGQDGKSYRVPKSGFAGDITIDDELSTTSENPVQNKVIKGALDGLEEDTAEAFGIISERLDEKADIIISSASGSIAHIEDAGAYKPVGLTVYIEPVQEGSGDPSPENVRPISGYTGVEVYATGKNLLKLVESEMTSFGWNRRFPFKTKSGTYTMSCVNQFLINDEVKGAKVELLDSYGTEVKEIYNGYNFGSSLYSFSFSVTKQEAEKVSMIEFRPSANGATADTFIDAKMQLEVGSTSSTYEPYNNATLPITWQTEAGTVYKGSLDLITGELKSYPYYASYNGETLTGHWISSMDVYAEGTSPSIGAQVINDGAEPTVYNLTPPEIFTLLKGVNNIWNDVGNTDAVYKADTKLFIEKAIAEAVAAL